MDYFQKTKISFNLYPTVSWSNKSNFNKSLKNHEKIHMMLMTFISIVECLIKRTDGRRGYANLTNDER